MQHRDARAPRQRWPGERDLVILNLVDDFMGKVVAVYSQIKSAAILLLTRESFQPADRNELRPQY